MLLNKELFLASASIRRVDLLEKAQIPFTKIPNLLTDETVEDQNLRQAVKKLAFKKVITSKNGYQGLILGVDTIVVIDGFVLGKPENINEAKSFLKLLSGKTHFVFSGLCLYDTMLEKCFLRSCRTKVKFISLTDEAINYYCANYQVLDKAGAYAIQEYADKFVEKIEGPVDNVIGLPMKILLKLLRNYVIVAN
ncbi:MAG: nucleoside triphosphate pyrophosphatase [Candidatus Margulisiibacteriota bacterium]|jgi:septum formation protein